MSGHENSSDDGASSSSAAPSSASSFAMSSGTVSSGMTMVGLMRGLRVREGGEGEAAEVDEGYHVQRVSVPMQMPRQIGRAVVASEWTVRSCYRLFDKGHLGTGTYGSVVSALDSRTQEVVAIKRCPDVRRSATYLRRITREMILLRHLSHPNLVRLRDAFSNSTRFSRFRDVYFVFDRAASDLHRVLRQRPLSEQERRRLLYDIIKGVNYMHACNVLHRDLKPANILIGSDGSAKLCDFGLARSDRRRAHDPTLTMYVISRPYRAPELILESPYYSDAIDMWSVGCVFAEMYLQKLLFEPVQGPPLTQLRCIFEVIGTPPQDEVADVCTGEALRYLSTIMQPRFVGRSFKSLFPDAPPAAIDLLQKLLRFHPNHRIAADQALAHEYFAPIRSETDELISSPFESEVSTETPESELAGAARLWAEMRDLHPDMEQGPPAPSHERSPDAR